MMRNLTFDSHSIDEEDTPTAAMPPVSPANGAESLFLAGLVTQNISAHSLASKLRQAHRSTGSISDRSVSGGSVFSVLTDDFQSCASQEDFMSTDSADETDEASSLTSAHTAYYSIHTNSRKSQAQATILEEPHENDLSSDNIQIEKTNTTMPATTSTMTAVPPPAAAPPVPEPHGADVAEVVYEKAKGIWAWGKGLPLVSIGLGLTEAVLGKAVSVVGTDLQDIDSNLIKPQLANLDGAILNPAIDTVVGVVLGAAGKTEEVFKPIIFTILSPFGLIKNEPESTA